MNRVYIGTAVTENIAGTKQSTNSGSRQQQTLKLRIQSQHILTKTIDKTTTGVIITGYHKQEINIPKFLGNKSYY